MKFRRRGYKVHMSACRHIKELLPRLILGFWFKRKRTSIQEVQPFLWVLYSVIRIETYCVQKAITLFSHYWISSARFQAGRLQKTRGCSFNWRDQLSFPIHIESCTWIATMFLFLDCWSQLDKLLGVRSPKLTKPVCVLDRKLTGILASHSSQTFLIPICPVWTQKLNQDLDPFPIF